MNKHNATSPGAHLVGSVPLANCADVFANASRHLGEQLKRIPDGETGKRSNWINWQYAVLAECPQLEREKSGETPGALPKIRICDGVKASDVDLGPLGYSAAALSSFAEFSNQKRSGSITDSCRFQVSLPTPLAPIQFYVTAEDRAQLEPVYEQQLLAELHEILANIPNDELAVQWDTAVEFGILEGTFISHLKQPFHDIIERLGRLGNAVPNAVEVGYHLCYGDSNHKHFVEPEDAGHLAAIANGIVSQLNRPLNWVHLPVPRERFDDGFYEPLTSLALPSDTDLYLGLVHMSDGEKGTRHRMKVAHRFVDQFGIATECGFGRRPAATVDELLTLHSTILTN